MRLSCDVPTANAPYHTPCVQIGSRFTGDSLERSYLFTTDRPHCILKCPHFPGTITAEWFWLCVRSLCHHIWHMRTFDENSCAISITSPRSLSPLPDPTCLVGPGRCHTSLVGPPGEVTASVHTMGLPGKVPLSGTSPGKRDPI